MLFTCSELTQWVTEKYFYVWKHWVWSSSIFCEAVGSYKERRGKVT